jgi:hypothetical protein
MKIKLSNIIYGLVVIIFGVVWIGAGGFNVLVFMGIPIPYGNIIAGIFMVFIGIAILFGSKEY